MSFKWLHVDWGDRPEFQGALGVRLSLHPTSQTFSTSLPSSQAVHKRWGVR